MKKLGLLVLLAAFMFVPVNAVAMDVDDESEGVTFGNIDAAWTWTDDYDQDRYAGGIRINYILFSPGAAGDICVIRDTDINGIILFKVKCEGDTDQRTLYLSGDRVKPYLDIALGAPNADAILTIKFDE